MYDLDTLDKRLLVFGYLFRVSNRLQSKMDALMDDLTAKQWFVILALGLFDEPPTLTQLAAACDTSHQNTKQLVRKLAEKGFVTITHDPKDGRAMRIAATEQCARWDRENEAKATQFVNRMFAGLRPGDVAGFSDALMQVFENLGNVDGGITNA